MRSWSLLARRHHVLPYPRANNPAHSTPCVPLVPRSPSQNSAPPSSVGPARRVPHAPQHSNATWGPEMTMVSAVRPTRILISQELVPSWELRWTTRTTRRRRTKPAPPDVGMISTAQILTNAVSRRVVGSSAQNRQIPRVTPRSTFFYN